MKKQLLKIAVCVALITPVIGTSQQKVLQPCDTYAAQAQYFESNPKAKVNFEKVQSQLQSENLEHLAGLAQGKISAPQYTIPVVFHVLHMGGSENLSDAQIIAALAQVNRDYAREGSDTNTIFAPFKALYVNCDIKFMLAKKDPNGNCTTGIEHLYDSRTVWDRNPPSSGANPALFAGITWPTQTYLNVIVVKTIVAAPGQSGVVIGYTFIPGTFSPGAIQDAIIYTSSFLSGLDARSLSHEMGHWLNLIHTFGNTNNPGVTCGSTSGGDQVADTPDTKGNFSTCPASSTNTAYTCTSPNPSNANNYYQNVENIMDYSSCPKNFTQGQATRMQTALQSPTAGRSNLWTAANLALTDVNGTGICAPIADFHSTTGSYTVCAGSSLIMKDFSYNGPISSYQWAADNSANVVSPTVSVTTVQFPSPGTCNVTLTISNGTGSSTKVKSVTVLPNSIGFSPSTTESFELPGIPLNWSVDNPNAGSAAWAQTNLAASDGLNSFYIEGIASGTGHIDDLITPIFDLVNNPNATFSFGYAYARQSSTHNDELRVQASLDCGATWQNIVTFSAAQLANGSGGVDPSPFIPAPSQWKEDVLSTRPNWSNLTSSSAVMIRFEFVEAGFGNNIFIDKIAFSAPTGINELTRNIGLNMYPNPTVNETTLSFHLSQASTIEINVLDVLGRPVQNVHRSELATGEQKITVNSNHSLTKGIYFVELNLNGAKMSKKLVIN